LSDKYILLDSDVLSFLIKQDELAKPYVPDLKGKIPLITFQTRAELLRLPIERKWGPTRTAKMKEYLNNIPVIESGPLLAQKWADVRAWGRQHGRPVDGGDVGIGAAALLYDIPLATHNRRDFAWMTELGLKLVCHAPELE
jgi:tRNA(fMet)-specific endonuclease VapC